MREVLYKNEYIRYESIKYKDYSPVNSLTNEMIDDEDIFSLFHYSKSNATQKHPLFLHDSTFKDEETFLNNFGNPMWSVSKQYFMVVVEKEGDKVAIKTFDGFLHRRGGVQWFKKTKNI
jgi:hypothetical protein